MAYNFKSVDRETSYLMPPSMREWLPAKHLAWFIVDAVEGMDLGKFYLGYRSDGWGRAAYEPKMMTALLLYAYCLGERSSREIEKACEVWRFEWSRATGGRITRRSAGSDRSMRRR